MRPGYFKVDAGEHGAMLILPGPFMKDTPVIQVRHWLDAHGISEPLVYRMSETGEACAASYSSVVF